MLLRSLGLFVSGAALVAASPTALDRRQATTSTTATTSSATETRSMALMLTTISGTGTTIEVPIQTDEPKGNNNGNSNGSSNSTVTGTGTQTGESPAQTSSSYTPSGDYPVCKGTGDPANPFCAPSMDQELWIDNTYIITWDYTHLAAKNVTIKLNYYNDTSREVFSSGSIPNSRGSAAIKMEKDWLLGYGKYNMTFFLLASSDANATPTSYTGPKILLTTQPAKHYRPSSHTAFHKEGLMIGLPVALAFVALVIVGLFFGMRKHRTIGLGNIMSRSRGYGSTKSRRQRLGLSKKKGGIHLDEVEVPPEQQYRDNEMQPPRRDFHTRQESLGSLVGSDDGRGAFRNEVRRQQNARGNAY